MSEPQENVFNRFLTETFSVAGKKLCRSRLFDMENGAYIRVYVAPDGTVGAHYHESDAEGFLAVKEHPSRAVVLIQDDQWPSGATLQDVARLMHSVAREPVGERQLACFQLSSVQPVLYREVKDVLPASGGPVRQHAKAGDVKMTVIRPAELRR